VPGQDGVDCLPRRLAFVADECFEGPVALDDRIAAVDDEEGVVDGIYQRTRR